MKEEIRMIPWTNGYYGATEDGNIYRLKNRNGACLSIPKRLNPRIHCGYPRVHLRINGIRKQCFVHRLVAETFIPNPENLPQVNHKNEIKTDNRVENLEWMTSKDNVNYGTGIIRRAKKISKKVNQLSDSGEVLKTFNSQREAAKFFNVSQQSIYQMLSERNKNRFNLHYA